VNKPVEKAIATTTDAVQSRLAEYACALRYEALSPDAIHACKVRVIDTLGALFGGFFDEPCRIGRALAARVPDPRGGTIIGTRMKTTPDMAAFVNATASRCVEMNDTYHGPHSHGGHPSDVVLPVFAVAEHAAVSGRDLITAVVLAYEAYLRVSDQLPIPTGFDCTTFATLGTAVAGAKLLRLTHDETAQAISMAVVPNNAVNQARSGHLTMWKAVAAGQAGRAGVFAALLAQEGMVGAHLPFEGNAGWCDYVAKRRFTLDTFGGNGIPFKVEETLLKKRACCATSVSTILAAENVAPLIPDIRAIESVTIETYKWSQVICASGEHHWHPTSRETADHSIPYGVAAAILDGTVTPSSFDDAHLCDPRLQALMAKVEVVVNDEFTAAYEQHPVVHRSRATVLMKDGKRLVGEAGGDESDLSSPMTDAQVTDKFTRVAVPMLGAKRTEALLERLWQLEDCADVSALPALCVFA
jgi:2-methylcitrate dehydratase